jgi:hypothetical protein
MNNNLCTKEKINLLTDNINKYKISYTKYLVDKEIIKKEKDNLNSLLDEKNFELQSNLLKKNQEILNIKCNSKNSYNDCYLKCKENFNPTDRKPDITVTSKCDNSENNICECNIPDYKSIDVSINNINELLKKKLDFLEKETKLIKPENLTIKNPCCLKDIVCVDGNCSSIDELCKVKQEIESFTTNNNYIFNTNHILIIIIIILIVFFLCQK